MARPSKPWWWAARGRWAATVDGSRRVAPEHIRKGDEHAAWAWHAEVMQGVAPVPMNTVQGLAEAYLEWDESRVLAGDRDRPAYQSRCSALQRACDTRLRGVRFGDFLVASVRADDFDRLLAEWSRAGVSPGYRRSLASSLMAVFAWAARRADGRPSLIEASPFAGLKPPAPPAAAERFATRSEAARWLRWLWRRGLRDFATLQRCLIHTGARPSELTRATWGELKWGGATTGDGLAVAVLRRVAWKNGRKTGKPRRVLIPPRLTRALKRREGAPADLMFRTGTGLPWTASNLAGQTRAYRREAIIAGVPLLDAGPDRMTCYRWRHTAASSLLMSGVAVATVAELLGTSPQYITSTYGHLLADHLADAAAKLASRRL